MKQWTNIILRFKFNKSATKTYEMFQFAYGDNAMNYSPLFEWFSSLQVGKESSEDGDR